jgi:DNA-binding MarR family transcriptional regulator
VLLDIPLALCPESIERLAEMILAMQRCSILNLSEALAAGQISFVQYFLLSHLNACESISMTEIAEKMHHTTAAATGVVDRLEKFGYVERMPAPNDRRKVLVRIKPKGAELVGTIRADMVEKLTRIMLTLTQEEQRMWLQIYEKIFSFVQNQTTCSRESQSTFSANPS